MKYMMRLATVVFGLLVIAGPAMAEAPPSTADVLGRLHSSNVRAYRMGKLALERGQAKDVQMFGQTLIDDGAVLDAEVVQLAQEQGIVLAANTPEVGPLRMPTGREFDEAFARDTLVSNEKDLAELKAVRDTTTDRRLRALLTDILPVLEKHEQIAQTLVDQGTS